MTRAAAVLVVDDNEANRDALSRRLRQKGYDVSVAVDGPDALAQTEHHAFDLILLDVEMPGMSGFEVLQRVRLSRTPTELPVIMATARTHGEDVVEALRLGANDYVTKPIDFQVALARIRTHLAHKAAVESLRASEERYALAIRGSNDALWDWDLVTDEVHWSPRWAAMLGYPGSAIGVNPDEWLRRIHRDDVARVKATLAAHLADASQAFESEHRLVHRSGAYRWVLARAAAVRNHSGTPTRLVGHVTDITDAKVGDALTGLPNRLLCVDWLDRAIERARRHPEYTFALVAFGLDRFKSLNDTLGRLTADTLLTAVTRRLQASLTLYLGLSRDRGEYALARLGGDELALMVGDIRNATDAVRVADHLQNALSEPFEVDGTQVYASAAIGIAVSTTGYQQPEDMLRDAATALNRAKAQDTGTIELFDPAMRAGALERLRLEADLRQAVADGALEVHYQPITCIRSGSIYGTEALVRWHHPSRGSLRTAEFIPVAEDAGLLADISRLVLTQACRQMVQWRARIGTAAPRIVSVNISARQFADAGLPGDVAATLTETGLAGHCLHLEITESGFIGSMETARETLNRLRAIGVACSIDDFGTGYSSLSYLHHLQAGAVKIDRSFVQRLGDDGRAAQLVGAIADLAHAFDMLVVAEGVETEEQLGLVRALSCDYAQGFYFSGAVDAAVIEEICSCEPWWQRPAALSSTPA